MCCKSAKYKNVLKLCHIYVMALCYDRTTTSWYELADIVGDVYECLGSLLHACQCIIANSEETSMSV